MLRLIIIATLISNYSCQSFALEKSMLAQEKDEITFRAKTTARDKTVMMLKETSQHGLLWEAGTRGIMLKETKRSSKGRNGNIELIITELLFNPARDGFDFVEIYNRGPDEIDLGQLKIGNRNSTGDPAALRRLADTPTLLRSGQYCVVTANLKWVGQHYRVASDAIGCEISSPPSWPDDEGTVLVMNNADSGIIDELHYNKDWHFSLLADPEGVSLERISFTGFTQDPHNWISASASAGYATPGAENSQRRDLPAMQGAISVTPNVFTPDGDGIDDYLLVGYQIQETGAVANGTVYDASGRLVRHLVRNALLGSSGQFKWDGLDNNRKAIAAGLYVLVMDIFTDKGKKMKFKRAVVLGKIKN